MAATASRLGTSPITLDWSNFTNVRVGSKPAFIQPPQSSDFSEAWLKLCTRFQNGEVGFYDTPIRNELSQFEETKLLASQLLSERRFTDCLFLGIGGSALGPMSLLSALQDRRRETIRLHFFENPDPVDWKGVLRSLRPETTLVCPIAKSGTTFETISTLLLALDWLGQERISSHVIAITDPERGDLRAFSKQERIRTLNIAPSIGGRFSVFSPVGLFPAALGGLDIAQFLLGTKQVREAMEKSPVEKNPVFILGNEFIRQSTTRPIHVCMPYSTRLKMIGAWFVQLWAESLGKNGKGFTPVAAVGATDQHSILQLLRDGPDDKVTIFLTIDETEDEVSVPKLNITRAHPAFKLLEGTTLKRLLDTEYRATSLVLTKRERPNFSIRLDRLDERSLGALYFFFSVLTAFTGTLWGVNPFDQPGVEEGKVYIREALSQSQSH